MFTPRCLLNVLLLSVGAFATPLEALEKRQARTKINPNFYPTLVRYTNFAAAAYAITGGAGCPNPPYGSKIVRNATNEVTDTQFVVFRDDAAKEIIVSIPGTATAQDLITDFVTTPVVYTTGGAKCEGCLVHTGFYTAWRSIAAHTEAAITNITRRYPGYAVTLTGHSLGGAIAGVAYPDLLNAGFDIRAIYTFGQPRIGNQAFADFVDTLSGSTEEKRGNYYRTTHTFDGVPQLPSQSQGFQHSRTEFFELDTKNGTQSAARTFRCYGQEAPDCNKGRGMGFINEAHTTYTGVVMNGYSSCGIKSKR